MILLNFFNNMISLQTTRVETDDATHLYQSKNIFITRNT